MVAKAQDLFLFQFGANDPYVPRALADAFYAAAPDKKKVLFSEAGHEFNAQSVEDRMQWLTTGLGLR